MRQLKLFIILSLLLSFITGQLLPIASSFENKGNDLYNYQNAPTKCLSLVDMNKYELKMLNHIGIINIGNDPVNFELPICTNIKGIID